MIDPKYDYLASISCAFLAACAGVMLVLFGVALVINALR